MNLKKKPHYPTALFAVSLLFILALAICIPKQAEAKTSGYTTLHSNFTFGYSSNAKMTAVKKVGNTYIKCIYKDFMYESWAAVDDFSEIKGTFYYSSNKNSGYKKFLTTSTVYNDIATNGEKFVYVKLNHGDEKTRSSDVICRDIRNNSETNLCHFSGDNFVKIVGASGNHIYLRAFRDIYYYYYDVDVSTKRVSKVEANPWAQVYAMEGKYAIADNYEYIGFYKITSGKLKLVKKLLKSKNGDPTNYGGVGIINGKVYYVDTGGGFSRSMLKRCTLSGKKKKVLGKFRRSGNIGKIEFMKVTSKYCILKGKKNFFKYTYKGKKFKKIKKKRYKKELAHMLDILK